MKRGIILKAITVIKKLDAQSCTPDFLAKFNRYQEVKRCWRKENGEWRLKDIPHIAQWNDKEKMKKIAGLRSCISRGGVVLGAFVDNDLIGFASVGNRFFGAGGEYLRLEMLHVSYEHRRTGIGKMLFHEICSEAKALGAKKLYITAHSSEETQAFYKSVGCTEATEVIGALLEEEPIDCHLEYCL